MDLPESTKVVYNRIQKLDPENVSKILGYILIQEHADRDMIRLAFSPDNMLHTLINKIKTRLGLTSTAPVSAPISPPQVIPNQPLDIPLQFMHFSQSPSRPFSSPGSLRASHPYTVEFAQPPYADSAANRDYHLQNQLQLLSLEDQLDNSVGSDFSSTSSNFYCQEPALGPRTNRRSPSLPEFPLKVCHYYIKGFCKHGNNCRYFHPTPESFSQMLNNPSPSVFHNEDNFFSPGSLEKLELEITELLKSRRGFPVSIASLPMLYYEKYGRSLQADGYLTESQRHGKAGYSLTKLLARLKNNIRLIDRPHGQHSVILAEDYLKYMDFNGERSDQGVIVASSRQIYLTFPAESTFTEQDVSDYFNKYGPVQDVRIPCQQKRMFGFVTFVFAETVKHILTKGNPHFVCGARVLVKPYREKSRLIDRKHVDKMQHSMYNGSHFDDQEPELHSMPQVCDNSALIRQKLLEEHQALELDRKHLPDMQFVPKAKNHYQSFGYSIDEFKLPEARAEQTARAERTEFTSADHLSYMLDVLNNGSTADDKVRLINTRYDDQESCGSQGLNLPDSPFAAPIGSGISTVT